MQLIERGGSTCIHNGGKGGTKRLVRKKITNKLNGKKEN